MSKNIVTAAAIRAIVASAAKPPVARGRSVGQNIQSSLAKIKAAPQPGGSGLIEKR